MSAVVFCILHLCIHQLYSTENDHHIKSENMTENEIEILLQFLTTTYHISRLPPSGPYVKQVYEGITTYRLEIVSQISKIIETQLLYYLVPFHCVGWIIEYFFAQLVIDMKEKEKPDDLDGISHWWDVLEGIDRQLIADK